MWIGIIAAVLVIGGCIAFFISFGGAMTDGAEPAWCVPVAWGGLASVAIGIFLGVYSLITFAVNLWQR
jgi:hypothetical protein